MLRQRSCRFDVRNSNALLNLRSRVYIVSKKTLSNPKRSHFGQRKERGCNSLTSECFDDVSPDGVWYA